MKSTLFVLALISSLAHAGHVVKCVEPGQEQDFLSLSFNGNGDVIAASYFLGSYEGQPEFEASALVIPQPDGVRVALIGVLHSEVTYQLPAALFDPAQEGIQVATSFLAGTAVLPATCTSSF